MSDPETPSARFSLRRISKAQWAGIVSVFLLVVLFQLWTELQAGHFFIGADPYYHRLYWLVLNQPDIFQADPFFGNPAYAQKALAAYPLHFVFLGLAFNALGFLHGLAALQVIVSLVFLLAAFYLLYRFTGRPWISAFVALLGARQMAIFPSENWGVLSIGQVIPGTFFIAVAPVLFWAWLRFEGEPRRRRWVFLALGLAGVLHPLSWYTVTLSMLFAQLAQARFRVPAIKEAMLCGFIALLPMVPFIISWFLSKPTPQVSGEAYTITLNVIMTFFSSLQPKTLGIFHQGLILAFGWVTLGIWAAIRVRAQIPRVAWYFALGGLLLFLASYALNEWVLIPRQMPVFIDGNRTLKFIMLPVMLAIALWLSAYRGKQLLWRMVTVLVLIVFLNARLLFHDLSDQAADISTVFSHQWLAFTMPPPEFSVQSRQSVVDTAQWLKENTTSGDTLVHVSHPESFISLMIRALGERSVTHVWLDGGMLYLQDKPQLVRWYQTTQALDRIRQTQKGYCTDAEADYARSMQATHLLCSNQTPHDSLPAVYRNDFLTLYRLPAP